MDRPTSPEATADQSAVASFDLVVLAELVSELARETDLGYIASALAAKIKWILPSEWCSLLIVDDDRRGWRTYPSAEHGRSDALAGPIATALERGTAVMIDDLAGEASRVSVDPLGCPPTVRSLMVLPLEVAGDRFGALMLGSAVPGAFPMWSSALSTLLQLNVAAVAHNARQVARLRHLSEFKSRLVAHVSHDYRNPLSIIIGFTELMLLDPPDPSTGREMLETILREAERLSELVDEVLDLSRVSLEGGALRREPIDLEDLAFDSVRPFQEAGMARGRHTFRVTTQPARVLGDPIRLSQVLANYVGNAVKYSPAGGPVSIDVRVRAARGEALVAVGDSGLGIEREALDTLFQPFRRANGAIRSGIQGVGLGLAICREIADAHGGRVWAESEGPGQGSTFYLVLPLAQDRSAGRSS